MKILRKGDDFIKVHDANKNDLIKINTLLESGWNYSPKSAYKEAKGKSISETKAEKKEKEAKEAKVKETKKDKKEDQGKKQYKEKKEAKIKKDNKKDKKDKKGKK